MSIGERPSSDASFALACQRLQRRDEERMAWLTRVIDEGRGDEDHLGRSESLSGYLVTRKGRDAWIIEATVAGRKRQRITQFRLEQEREASAYLAILKADRSQWERFFGVACSAKT